MSKTIEAFFDGEALHPDAPLEIPRNTRVRLTIEGPVIPPATESFLRTARALKLTGPPDWSANLEAYLYDQKPDQGQ
jgi:hypothetical protein